MRRSLSLLVLLSLTACSLVTPKFTKPVLTVVGVDLVSGTLLKQNVRVRFNIDNPNDRLLPVTRLHADLSVAGENVASGDNDHAFVVPAHGETQFDMNITANLALVLLKLAGRHDAHADSVDYELTGNASIDLPFLRALPFRQSGSLPLRF